MSNELTTQKESLMSKENMPHYMKLANQFADSAMVPKAYRDKPMDILIAMEMGNQLGLPMLQSLQDIAIINGKPCIYGDGLLAVVQGHPDYEWIKEEPIIKEGVIIGYSCTAKRKHHEPHTYYFTINDAKKAGLLGRTGPWTQYQSRMLQMRARGFCLRNTFADALRGVKSVEEIEDYPENTNNVSRETFQGTQTEKLKQKLSEKGFTSNEQNANVPEINHHSSNPDIVDADYVIQDENIQHPAQANENSASINLGSNGEPENRSEDTSNVHSKITESQLESIELNLHFKEFTQERINKALKHFGVRSFVDMTSEQADEMIILLDKAE